METEEENENTKPDGVRLLIGNLPFGAEYKKVVEALSEHAKLLDLHVPAGSDGSKNKGWGIGRVPVHHADKLLNSTIVLDGRILRVQLAR